MTTVPRPHPHPRFASDEDACGLLDAVAAANYLYWADYLLDNPLMREPLRLEHIKPRCWGLGHHAWTDVLWAHSTGRSSTGTPGAVRTGRSRRRRGRRGIPGGHVQRARSSVTETTPGSQLSGISPPGGIPTTRRRRRPSIHEGGEPATR